ncbi:putative heat shock protein HspR [bacterium BMS3Abin04]|nr:putative heat shock protein HspR [bacterium BMS3Abin04]
MREVINFTGNNFYTNEEAVLPIRTAAKMIGISIPTLRMYEREGLIIPHKSPGNQRLYSANDIRRIERFRRDIKKRKISINGVLTILSMLPCQLIINCSEKDRENCEAFHEIKNPCWTYKHSNNICGNIDCRECEIYKNNYDCESTMDTIIARYK